MKVFSCKKCNTVSLHGESIDIVTDDEDGITTLFLVKEELTAKEMRCELCDKPMKDVTDAMKRIAHRKGKRNA